MPHIESQLWNGLLSTRNVENHRLEESPRLFGLFGHKVIKWRNEGVSTTGYGQYIVRAEEHIPVGIAAELRIGVPIILATITEQDPEDIVAPKRAVYEIELSPGKRDSITGRKLEPIPMPLGGNFPAAYRGANMFEPEVAAAEVSNILEQAVFL